jgi:hypothetical protein
MNIVPTNIYDRLYKKPLLEKKQMPKQLEYYAQKMVEYSLLRINADDRSNFVTFPVHGGTKFLTFTKRELFDKKFLPKSIKLLKDNLSAEEKKNEEENINIKLFALQAKVKKYIDVPDDWEIKIARLLAQSCHPAIFKNLVENKTQVFVSFSHTISDLLSVKLWKSARHSQGLQNNGYSETGIFVSTGGHPFFDPEESKNEYDGFKALARLMVIAAQEIGHYSEIRYDDSGRAIGRFSADYNGVNQECFSARKEDLQITKSIIAKFKSLGIDALYEYEKKVQIDFKYRKLSPITYLKSMIMWLKQNKFKNKCARNKLGFIKKLKSKFIAQETLICLNDMLFNIEVNSLSYKDENPEREKMIICAEALARVPQQEIKWGKKITGLFMPNLQKYYGKVIEENIKIAKLKQE